VISEKQMGLGGAFILGIQHTQIWQMEFKKTFSIMATKTRQCVAMTLFARCIIT
jgi:hypothetical protein